MESCGSWLIHLPMVFKRKTIALVILATFGGSSLAYPVYATDVFASVKFGLDTAAKAAAHGAFTAVSQRILNKIQTGGIGGALFVQDWREFQLKSQYRGEDVFRGILNKTKLCDYFGKELKNLFGANQSIDLSRVLTRVNGFDSFQAKTGCTLPNNFDFNKYKQDFSGQGGWEAWSRLLEPQNNFYGALFQSLGEANLQRAIEESAATNEAVSGKGYTGIRDCLTRKQGASACTVLGRIKTPGSTIGEQVTSVFDTNLKFYTTADAASLAVALVTEFLVGKLIDQGLAPDSGTPAGSFVPGTDPEEVKNSYKSEFCSARDNMATIPAALYIFKESQSGGRYPGAYQMFPPEEDGNAELNEATRTPRKAWDDSPPDVGKSYCKWRFDIDDNKDPFTRCMRACYQKLELGEGNNLLTPEHIGPDGRWIDAGGLGRPAPLPPGGGGGGGTGVCRNPGGTTADYAGALRSAIDAVIANNPGGIADAPNTTSNSFTFLDHVTVELQSAGFNATTNVLNGNDNPNQGDLIAVWRAGDSTIERYDAVTDAGAGNMPMQNAAITDYTGDIPLSCVP